MRIIELAWINLTTSKVVTDTKTEKCQGKTVDEKTKQKIKTC